MPDSASTVPWPEHVPLLLYWQAAPTHGSVHAQMPDSASTVPWPEHVPLLLCWQAAPTHGWVHVQLPFLKVPWLLHEPGRSAAMVLATMAADAHEGTLADNTL